MNDLEAGLAPKRRDVLRAPGGKVIQHCDRMPLPEQPLAQVRPDEPRAARHERLHLMTLICSAARPLPLPPVRVIGSNSTGSFSRSSSKREPRKSRA